MTVHGAARFIDPHTIEVASVGGSDAPALGPRPDRLRNAAGPQRRRCLSTASAIIDSDQLLQGTDLPRDLIVVGAGVIGLEYASMVTALNIKVTVIEARPTILDFVDAEMIEALMYFMRQRGATFRLGEKVVSVG